MKTLFNSFSVYCPVVAAWTGTGKLLPEKGDKTNMVVTHEINVAIANTKEIAKIFQDLLALEDEIDQDKEHFYVMHIDARNKVKMVELISLGTVNTSLSHPRETYRRAVKEGSVNIIVAHNHPSGDVEPSAEDIATTTKLFDAGEILDIRLLDHIIFFQRHILELSRERLVRSATFSLIV